MLACSGLKWLFVSRQSCTCRTTTSRGCRTSRASGLINTLHARTLNARILNASLLNARMLNARIFHRGHRSMQCINGPVSRGRAVPVAQGHRQASTPLAPKIFPGIQYLEMRCTDLASYPAAELYLSHNDIARLPHLSKLRALTHLDVGHNKLHDVSLDCLKVGFGFLSGLGVEG